MKSSIEARPCELKQRVESQAQTRSDSPAAITCWAELSPSLISVTLDEASLQSQSGVCWLKKKIGKLGISEGYPYRDGDDVQVTTLFQ